MKQIIVLIIDHLDSFTYNLVQYIGELGARVRVIRTNEPIEFENLSLTPTHLVLSPGYGHPRDVDYFLKAIEYWRGKIPILGVCLGHQAIALLEGADIAQNWRIMHGKESEIHHYGEGIFSGLPNPFLAGRYHSLAVSRKDCEEKGLKVIAWTEEDEVMGVQTENNDVMGVQFHPESILTPCGKDLLSNFLDL